MLVLNKLLPMFVLPLGWVFALVIYSRWRKRRWATIAAMVVLYVSSMRVTGGLLIGGLESRYKSVALAEVEKADAVVILGGMFGPTSAAGHLPNVAECGERLEAGIALWEHERAKWLVFTDGRLPWVDAGESEGKRARRFAVARGIPAEQILITGEVGNTADEALVVAGLMRQREWKRVILVTTAWHMPRAARLFRKAGVDFAAFPVDYQFEPDEHWSLLDFLPTAEGLRRTETGLRELYGIAFYALSGR